MSDQKKINRRKFIASTSTAALGVTASSKAGPAKQTGPSRRRNSSYSHAELIKRGQQRTFSGDYAIQVAMPLGGIGTGNVCLNAIGGLQDFSIRHRPQLTALADGHGYGEAAFALIHIKGPNPVTRLVEGPFPLEKVYDQGLQAQGYRHGSHEGFPRFEQSEFKGEYPFGEVKLSDPDLPLSVRITGWNPFIPLDDVNSGIPCAILEYTFSNTSTRRIDFEFSYHLSHLAMGCSGGEAGTRNTVIPGRGILFHNTETPNAESYGSVSLTVADREPVIKGMWLRSPGWPFDAVSALWREVSAGSFKPNSGSNETDKSGRNGGSIMLAANLAPGEEITFPIIITWYFPNSYLEAGGTGRSTRAGCTGGEGCCSPAENVAPAWRPFYASKWKDARDVARYITANYKSLRSRTAGFKSALFDSTLPDYVLDAVSANLGILKSPTVLRQENGNLWGWEGCFATAGCCHGSCTHVWNYAQAFPNLFPKLERTLREQELERSMNEAGHVTFRAALPDGPPPHTFYAAADGQLGGIMKLYRDWQISGDTEWLKKLYPLAKRSLDYCIQTWDPDHRGGLFEPHHNTYDIEFWGPDGMCTSIYAGALSALALMARAVGRNEDAPVYEELASKCARLMDDMLFNGEYYQQKVQYEGLRNTSFVQMIEKADDSSGEMLQLLKREGPKYQYGSGCLSDGVIGAWMARIYGIETPLDREKICRTLQSIFRYNFKPDLSRHANAQRPGYAMGHEPGLLLCSWPRGNKPTLPFVYSDEVWTGIEYQVASHLIEEGFVKEGLTIVKALRSRYDGRARNPWNEYECGNYYARAMASYSLLGSLAGLRYSAVEKRLWFGPRLKERPFRTFFSTADGFGTISLDNMSITIEMLEGKLALRNLVLSIDSGTRDIEWDIVVEPGKKAVKRLV